MPRWTEEQLREYLRRGQGSGDAPRKPEMAEVSGQAPRPDRLNKTEAAFLATLKHQWPFATILSQQVKLRLAQKTWYTPDFILIQQDMSGTRMLAYEVKGFMRDDAAVKLKVAAEAYPFFEWHLVRKTKGGWHLKRIP